MNVLRVLTALLGAMSLYIYPIHAHAQMLQIPVGGNWTLSGMGQVFLQSQLHYGVERVVILSA